MSTIKWSLLFVCLLVALGATMPCLAACTRATGCRDCVWSLTQGKLVCATVEYDASCSCRTISGGCDLGVESCDYIGKGCGDFCEEHQSAVDHSPLQLPAQNLEKLTARESMVALAWAEESDQAEPALADE